MSSANFSVRKLVAHFEQFAGFHWIEADLIEESQEPRRRELAGSSPAIPHLNGAAYELIAARAFHTVDAEIRSTDADGVFRGPGASGIVFCGNQPMPGVERRGDGCAEINVAEAEHVVAGIEDDAMTIVDRVEAVGRGE